MSDLEEVILWHKVKGQVVALVVIGIALNAEGSWELKAVVWNFEANPFNLFFEVAKEHSGTARHLAVAIDIVNVGR